MGCAYDRVLDFRQEITIIACLCISLQLVFVKARGEILCVLDEQKIYHGQNAAGGVKPTTPHFSPSPKAKLLRPTFIAMWMKYLIKRASRFPLKRGNCAPQIFDAIAVELSGAQEKEDEAVAEKRLMPSLFKAVASKQIGAPTTQQKNLKSGRTNIVPTKYPS